MKGGFVFFLGKGDEMRKVVIFLCIILLLAAAPLTAGAATVTFDQATMSTFIYIDDFNSGTGLFDQTSLYGAANPAYAEGTGMTGAYGWVGRWKDTPNNPSPGDTGVVYIGVSGVSLDWSTYDDVSQVFWNDNDDIWSGGLWVTTAFDGRVETHIDILGDGDGVVPGVSSTVTLDISALTGPITGYGVAIDALFGGAAQPSTGDQFHMSSSPVPLPAAAWLLGSGLVGLLGLRRRFKS